jgi:hypothetical protein
LCEETSRTYFISKERGLKMRKAVTLEKIEKEIERLTPQEQLKLVERLAHQLRKTGLAMKKELDWNKLYGLGKGLWKGEDAQEYVSRLREDRI